MKLTRDQINRMAAAAAASDNGDLFYVTEGKDGRITFGTVEVVERRKAIALGDVKVVDAGKVLADAQDADRAVKQAEAEAAA